VNEDSPFKVRRTGNLALAVERLKEMRRKKEMQQSG
jgi:hypothetical protein